MTTTRALPVWPHPLTTEQLSAVKEAKAQLELDYLIVPVRPEPLPPTPVLAFKPPEVIAPYALIRDNWGVENVKAALYAVLEQPDHAAIKQPAQQLSDILGGRVTEVVEDGPKFI